MKFIATLTALLAALISPLTVFADTAEGVVSGETPFVLIARLHALPTEADAVLRLSQAADEAVKASGPQRSIRICLDRGLC
jgi:hypothetical protein